MARASASSIHAPDSRVSRPRRIFGQARFSQTVARTPTPAASSAVAKYHANSLRRRAIVLAEDAASPEDQPAAQADVAEQGDNSGASPAPAAELARRGSALAARRDFGPALADLSKAIELSPNEPEFYYQRAETYSASGQADRALEDYNRVLTLRQDFLPAYIPRAEIKLAKGDMPAAMADLEAVDLQQAQVRNRKSKNARSR